MSDVRFVDTTLRDGQQSLWAYGMRTGMMLPVAAQLDQAGFEAIELGGPVELNKCVRELRENPWDRYRLLVAQIRKTPLRLIHGTRSGFAIYPHAVHQLYDQCIAAIGLNQVRISDSWNDSADWQWRVKQARRAGLEPIINLIYTAIPPLADGSSNPSIFNVAANARAMGYQPIVDEEPIRPVAKHFTTIAKQENLPIGETPEYDYAQYVHQIPGGMISNLRYQLRRVGMEDKIEQILEEAARVRAEFGYTIMMTPLSQFVGSQAAINVIVGERYKEVTDQTIQYALGVWGKEGAALMDTNIKDKILKRARAREIAEAETPQASLKELREKFGGQGVADEEILMRFFTGKEEVDKMRAAGPAQMYTVTQNPLLNLIEELAKQPNHNSIYFRKGDLSIRLVRRRMS